MPEMHLRHFKFTYRPWRPLIKNKERIQKVKGTGYLKHIYQKELDKTCFQHDMAYGELKKLPRRIVSDKIFCDKSFNIAKNLNYDGFERGLASMVYKVFDKKSSGGGVGN